MKSRVHFFILAVATVVMLAVDEVYLVLQAGFIMLFNTLMYLFDGDEDE